MAQAQQLAPSPTLDAIKARGNLECGVHLGLPGFSFANDKGEWSGLDVDYCKALAAAVLDMLAHRERWPAMRAAGRHFVEDVRNWKNSVANYAAVYHRLTDKVTG